MNAWISAPPGWVAWTAILCAVCCGRTVGNEARALGIDGVYAWRLRTSFPGNSEFAAGWKRRRIPIESPERKVPGFALKWALAIELAAVSR